MKLTISAHGIAMIKNFEYFVPHTYADAVGVLTIGYGSTLYGDGSTPKMGQTITEPEATKLLISNINDKASLISHAVAGPLNQNQQDAILSFAYNIGAGAFLKSTALKLININPKDPEIRRWWLAWNKAGGKVLPGLMKRRLAEYNLFNT